MATDAMNWTVFEHGPLVQADEHLWHVEGELPGRLALRRRMTVARTSSGSLALHSPIALDERGMKGLARLGAVEWIVVPSDRHRLDTPRYKARFPEAKVICPSGSHEQVAKVVEVAGNFAHFPADSMLSFEELDGVKGREGVMRVKSSGGTTLVFNDCFFNVHDAHWLVRLLGSAGGPKVTRVARTFLVVSKKSLRRHFERLAGIEDLTRIIPGHGGVIEDVPAEILRRVAATL